MSKLTYGRVLVLGRGASGQAAADLLRRQGREVVVADEKSAVSEEAGVLHSLAETSLSGIDLAVVSPGFAAEHPWLQWLRARSVRLIPEFELGLAAMPGVRVIAVTGSNGKSSLVKWISDTLCAAGRRAVPAGNYGIPPSALALDKTRPEFIVLELSSFQLEQARDFRAEISVLLNFAPNHLDRHGSMDAYARAKAQLFARVRPEDLVIAHAPSWPLLQPWVPSHVKPEFFGDGGARDVAAARLVEGTWWGRAPLSTNAVAACMVLERLGVATSLIREVASSFTPLPHRMEFVADMDGVHYINDSKASTLTALAAALEALPGRKHLIAGGILKEKDPGLIKEIVAKHAAFVYLIGVAAPKLHEAWREVVACEECGDLPTAFARAAKSARSGETVLLSPGCSSFDQFSSYGQRGDVFKALVRQRAG